MSSKGRLVVVSAPAGTGKTTLINRIVAEIPHAVQSVSYTTRAPRPGEIDGVHYHFISSAEFKKRLASGDFMEQVTLYGDQYGTSRSAVLKELSAGKIVFLVIDTQGASKLKGKVPATFIFISPPSMAILRERLQRRKTEGAEKIEERLKVAEDEIKKRKEYDYEIINDDLEKSIQEIKKIVLCEEKNGKSIE